MSSTKLVIQLTEEQAFKNYIPPTWTDVSGDELLNRNRVAFIEQEDGRVVEPVGASSENTVEGRLLAAKRKSMLTQGLATAVVAPVTPEGRESASQEKAPGILGFFKEKLIGKRKAPDLERPEAPTPKKQR